MIDKLDLKIRQMHLSLENLKSEDLSSVKVAHHPTDHGFYHEIDFNAASNEIELANLASLLIANIACMKNHLKVWCVQTGASFSGDILIDSDLSVALIHDLWNIDKHAELSRRPRSGHHPKIINLRKTLEIWSGSQPGSGGSIGIDQDGNIIYEIIGDGSLKHILSADIVDENGLRLGSFPTICEQAITAWEGELKKVGVIIS